MQTDIRSYIYSFGEVLSWLLTGKEQPMKLPLTKLEKVAAKCCAFSPDKRYKNDDELLEEDMVFTLEPGLYFDDLNLGIRIEDTLVVTKDGCEVMSDGIPKTVEEIEAFMAR